jgi:hypothetical protein
MNSIWDDHGFGIVRRPKKLLNSSHQQIGADYQIHLDLQRVLFIATTTAVEFYTMS